MTSAWEWDTTRGLFAEGWPQVNYAVTVAGEESNLNDSEDVRGKPKEAETARWMTNLINLKRDGHHMEQVVVLFGGIRVFEYLSTCTWVLGPQSNSNCPTCTSTEITVFIMHVSDYKISIWQLVWVLHFKDVGFHPHLILNKHRDRPQQGEGGGESHRGVLSVFSGSCSGDAWLVPSQLSFWTRRLNKKWKGYKINDEYLKEWLYYTIKQTEDKTGR